MKEMTGLRMTCLKLCPLFYLILAPSAFAQDILEPRMIYQKYDQGHYRDKPLPLLGLQVDKLLDLKKVGEARALLQTAQLQKGVPRDAVAWHLLKIAGLERRYRDFLNRLEDFQDSRFFKNTALMQELYQGLPKQQRSLLVKQMIKAEFFEGKPVSKCPYFELVQRKNRADFLYQLAREQNLPSNIKQKVFYELFIVTPEAIDNDALNKLAGFKEFRAGKTRGSHEEDGSAFNFWQ